MPGELQKHYKTLTKEFASVVVTTLAPSRALRFGQSHGYIEDWETWLSVLSTRPEADVLEKAIREYRLSLLNLSQGQYRLAFSSLRLFLELAIAAVYFSGHELAQRQWMANDYELRWATLSDDDHGPLSVAFVKAFCPEIAHLANQYRGFAKSVYKDCSEYVHGRWDRMIVLPGQAKFDRPAFDTWSDRAANVSRVLQFAYTARYVKWLSKAERLVVDPIIRGQLNHVSDIREVLDALS